MIPPAAPFDLPRHGEFQQLFWDLVPDAIVDTSNAVVLARLLTLGRPDDLRRTAALDVAAARLPELEVPARIRRFWQRVLRIPQDGW